MKGPEELAAGISRLSVIEESSEIHKMASSGGNDPPPPNLSQYFGSSSLASTSGGNATTLVSGNVGSSAKKTDENKDEQFFDNFSNKNIRWFHEFFKILFGLLIFYLIFLFFCVFTSFFFFKIIISDDDAVMQSCRESRLNLSNVDLKKPATGNVEKQAEIIVTVQANDDEKSLKRRQSQENQNKVFHEIFLLLFFICI